MVLMKKLERYLSDLNIKSGIDYERGNFPDKKWLILVIATLSKGKDPIFDPCYVPSCEIFGM